MTEQKTLTAEFVQGANGHTAFAVVWKYSSHWADVRVYEIVGVETHGPGSKEHGTPLNLYNRKDWKSSDDTTTDVNEAEVYLEGFIKWDGCSELNQGDHHFCGPEGLKNHCRLLEHLWKRSRELVDSGGMGFSKWESV